MTLPLARIEAKQKRLKDWYQRLDSVVECNDLRIKIVDGLKSYRNLLARCFEAGEVTPDLFSQIEDLERQLETFFEDARVSPVARHERAAH